MDWHRFPSLNSLKAFSVLATHESYTRAAQHLNVTHAAVNQQVRALENRLDVKLVERDGRKIRLTETGKQFAADLASSFERMAQAVDRVQERQDHRPVQITTSPAFAVEWLLPRLADFQQRHPDITLLLNPTSDIVPLSPGGMDIAVRYRDRRLPKPDGFPLLISDMVVIGHRDLIAGYSVESPSDLIEMPWLQELGTNEAAEWLTYRGVNLKRPLTLNQMPGNLIMTAVRRGDGVTYTARAFFKEELAAGTMIALFSEPAFGRYYIDTLAEPLRQPVATFLTWLKTQAEKVTVG